MVRTLIVTDTMRGDGSAASERVGVSVLVAAVNTPHATKQRVDYICDGVADEIQINLALVEVALKGGGIVVLALGDFTLAASVLMPSNCELVGMGLGTRVTFAASVGDVTMITNDCGYTEGTRHGTGNVNIAVRNFYIDGDKLNRGGNGSGIWTVGFNTVTGLEIEALTIDRGWSAGIRTEFCTNGSIWHNRIDNSGDDGIAINEESYNVACWANTVTNSGGYVGTVTTWAVTTAYSLGDYVKPTVVNDYQYECTVAGTSGGSEPSWPTTVGQTVVDGGVTWLCRRNQAGAPNCIEVQDGARWIRVFGNYCAGAVGSGIEVSVHDGYTPPSEVVVFGNTIVDCGWGIDVKGENAGNRTTHVNVHGNVVRMALGVSSYALRISDTENVKFTDNDIITDQKAGITYGSNTNLVIRGNTFACSEAAGNDRAGFYLNDTLVYCRFEHNLVTNFGYTGVLLDDAMSNCFVVDNQFVGVTRSSGAAIRFGSGHTASDCVLSRNEIEGTHWSTDGSTYEPWYDGWSGRDNHWNNGHLPNKIVDRYKNTSGGALAVGDVVIQKSVAALEEITTTTTGGDDKVLGMAVEAISGNAYGLLLKEGPTKALKVNGTTDIAVGDFLSTFTAVKIAKKAAAGDMAFAIALEAYTTDDSNGVIDALLIKPRKI